MMELKFKKLDYTTTDKDGNKVTVKSQGVLPTVAVNGSAGMDLVCTRITQNKDGSGKLILEYHTDIAVEIPEGYVGLLFHKSSVCNRSLMLCNAVGVLDHGYTGEIIAKMKVTTDSIPTIYTPGEKFVQLVVVPYLVCEPVFVEELAESERGDKGFGEADKQEENVVG